MIGGTILINNKIRKVYILCIIEDIRKNRDTGLFEKRAGIVILISTRRVKVVYIV